MSNAAMIEATTQALDEAKAALAKIEEDYQRLKAQVTIYETHLQNLTALEGGKYKKFVKAEEGLGESPAVRRGTHQLKDMIYEYYSSHPVMVQSPKGVCNWLITHKNCAEDGLRARVSNLLRKIHKEEEWLQRAGHGKYQFKQTT